MCCLCLHLGIAVNYFNLLFKYYTCAKFNLMNLPYDKLVYSILTISYFY